MKKPESISEVIAYRIVVLGKPVTLTFSRRDLPEKSRVNRVFSKTPSLRARFRREARQSRMQGVCKGILCGLPVGVSGKEGVRHG